MRFTISYYLLILYAVVIIRPIVPVVGDELSHEFNYMEHIATVHALYGDNHVEKEVAATSDKDDSKQTGNQKTEESIPFHLLNETYQYHHYTEKEGKPIVLLQPFYIKDILLPIVAPPPELSC